MEEREEKGGKSYRKENILLVLVDSLLVRNGVSVFDYADTLPSQNTLVHLQGGGTDLYQSHVSRDLVANWTGGKGLRLRGQTPPTYPRLLLHRQVPILELGWRSHPHFPAGQL